jgi:hypothetical protein
LQRRGPDQLLFVLASGGLTWDEAAARFDPDRAAIAGLVILTVCALAAAAIAVVQRQEAVHQRNQAETNLRAATAQKLIAQAQGMLDGTQPGSDARAFQQLLASRTLTHTPDDGALYSAVVKDGEYTEYHPNAGRGAGCGV